MSERHRFIQHNLRARAKPGTVQGRAGRSAASLSDSSLAAGDVEEIIVDETKPTKEGNDHA